MADDPVWQPNYVDLSDDSIVRFGGECVVCGARYTTPGEPRTTPPRVDGGPDQAMIAAFRLFDAAFHELQPTCFRCQRAACPDCWDDDHRMCAQCAADRGLARSPNRGLPASAPLARRQLQQVLGGRYHDVDRPSWLNQLLESSTQFGSGPLAAPESGPLGDGMVQTWMLGSTGSGSLLAPQAQYAQASVDVVAAATVKAPSVEESRVDDAHRPALNAGFEAPQPSARVAMLECPRCGVANFDFVTRCSNCQLQLIQTCPHCEHLNPGHAEVCEACGQPLERPRGWSGVHSTIATISPEEARERVNSVPRAATQAPRGYIERPPTRTTFPLSPRTTLPPMSHNAALAQQPLPMIEAPARIAEGMLGLGPSTGELADGRAFRFLSPGVERTIRLISVIGIVAIVSAGIAAVVSPSANTALYQMLHLDIRLMLQQFGAQLQTMWQHLHK
ncbi:MAG TPA: hypothetical protein VGS80_11420 [Ktedonobacterales bacterium]|nr:hypothetical protein [Ktedonobacterales bacterium]